MKTIQILHIMKRQHSFYLLLATFLLLITFQSCVHDDDYSVPEVVCTDNLTANISIADLKTMFHGDPVRITQDLILEGYIVSSDETGNIYKTLYIQDDPSNPTHGLTISIDEGDLYTKFPFGYKVFIKLKDLWLGEYGDVVQLGDMQLDDETGDYEFGRIPSLKVDQTLILGCGTYNVQPKVVTMNQFNPNLVGALIQLNNVQLKSNYLCEPYSLPEQTLNRVINDANNGSVLLRNSGYSSFTNETMPGGQGPLVAILSAYGGAYQLYIRSASDMAGMTGARFDGELVDCSTPEQINASIQDIKDQFSGGLTQITSDMIFDGVITANDATGNLYKYFYLEDETGGLRVNIDKLDMHFNPKYYVGAKIVIKAQDLYIDDVNGELQLGGLYGSTVGRVPEEEVYLHFFATQESENVTASDVSIANISATDIGKLVHLSSVEFIDSDVELPYASGGATNRTLQDCNGNTIFVRTSSFANFAGEGVPGGNGDITGILSVYNGAYQLWIRDTSDVDLNAARCDGSLPATTVFTDTFDNGLASWTAQNVTGAQVWDNPPYGNPAPCARMSGFSGGAVVNEDWLVSNAIDLSAYSAATFSFDNVKRYAGDDITAYFSTDYAGDATTATWTQLSPVLDTNTSSFNSWTNSGAMDISAAAGGMVYVAIKYTSTASAAATWEIDNVKVSAN